MKTHSILRLTAAFFILHSPFFISRAAAQQLAPITTGTTPSPTVTPTTTGMGAGDDIVQLSPFEVNASKDQGYVAGDTTAGSRVATPLKDTPAAISVFTPEFLNDVGATTISDMLAYGANVEFGSDSDDASYGFNSNGVGNPTGGDNNFRIRGMGMTTALDGVGNSFNMDTYNVDRAEISSGPNSILFGTGNPGGMVTLTSKKANLQRNTLRVSNILGVWQNLGQPWNYYRATLDYNLALMPRILALRVMGVYQDGTNTSWRYWVKGIDKRINPALTFKPWNNTTVSLSYENGRAKNNTAYTWNPQDNVTAWFDAGRPIAETFGGAAAGTNVIAAGTDNYVFVDNNQTMLNVKGTRQSINRYGNAGQVRLPAELASYYYSASGPGSFRVQQFQRAQLTVEQRIGDLNLQFGYFYNKNNAYSYFTQSDDATLHADPNRLTSPANYNNTTMGTLFNRYAGQLYMEGNWQKRANVATNNVYRLTAEYSLNLKKYGRHRLIGMLEHSEGESNSHRYDEILVDANGYAVSNIDNPAAAANFITRRHYLIEGDFRTYYNSDWGIPTGITYINGKPYTSHYVTRTSTNYSDNQHSKRRSDTASFTLQSYLFNDTVVATAGARLDRNFSTREQNGYNAATGAPLYRIDNTADPRLMANGGNMVWHEPVYIGDWGEQRSKTPFTYSYGAVYHATDRITFYFNSSTNRADDAFNQRRILPNGQSPPASEGITQDYGTMFFIPGKFNTYIRIAHFDTRQLNMGAAVNNANINNTYNGLVRIYDALHACKLFTDEQAPNYNAGQADVYARGYEAEVSCNLTRAFTMRFTFSYTDRQRINLFQEIIDYYDSSINKWMQQADPARNGYKQYFYQGGTLYDYLLGQLYAVGDANTAAASRSIRDNLATQYLQQGGSLGSRPLKLGVTAKYNFQQGILKGLSAMASARYQGPNYMPDPLRLYMSAQPVLPEDHPTSLMFDSKAYTDFAGANKGTSLLFYELMFNYRYKLMGGRTTMTLQLNIKNLFNNYVVTEGQRRATTVNGQSIVFLRRVYINEPRNIRLTATFDF